MKSARVIHVEVHSCKDCLYLRQDYPSCEDYGVSFGPDHICGLTHKNVDPKLKFIPNFCPLPAL